MGRAARDAASMAASDGVGAALESLAIMLPGAVRPVLRDGVWRGAVRWAGIAGPIFATMSGATGTIERQAQAADLGEDDIDVAFRAQLRADVDERINPATRLFTSTTLDSVSGVLRQSLAENLSVDQTARALRKSALSRYRAYRIARTEIVGAMNQTSARALLKIAPDARKEWISSQDKRVRATHKAADGQTRNQGELFLVGGSRLRYPGDRSHGADAGEVIHCRCTMGAIPPK